MEAFVRKPFQGVWNVIRFNWHFYAGATIGFGMLLFTIIFLPLSSVWVINTVAVLIILPVIISLGVSYYVYDRSGLYDFHWLTDLTFPAESIIVNINAGFDETSTLLNARYPDCSLQVFDFYDPEKHTEVSIARARKAYAPFPQTIRIDTQILPLVNGSADGIFNIFSLHEIRSTSERIAFLKQQYAALSENGYCVIVEHLRDVPNFLAYNIGFLHFHSPQEWRINFKAAGFKVHRELKITPFVSVFILKKHNGSTP